MPFPSLHFRPVYVLALCVACFLDAQPTTLQSNPAVKDLNQPAKAAKELTPERSQSLPELKLTAQFDQNGDHRLDAAERQAARAYLAEHPPADSIPSSGRPTQPAPMPAALEPVGSGEKITPEGVPVSPGVSLHDARRLRTLFINFEDADWEKELADFARTDVLVPARLTVDGRVLAGVGVRFRPPAGAAGLPAGYKRPLDLALDHTVTDQRFEKQRQLHLLDAGTDPTFVRAMLYYRVSREYVPTPRASFVRVVINSEDWGVYLSLQPLDENFSQENYETTGGARWTALPGGNLAYLGEDPAAYRSSYRIESADDPAAWAKLIELCRILKQTPRDQLETALAPHIAVGTALKFFALENAFINQDGYGSQTGGFGLYLAADSRFHLIPQEATSSFRLVQVTEYSERSRGNGGERDGRSGSRSESGRVGTSKSPGDPEEAALQKYKKKDFPKRSGTDLAMLLSYSFIAKADSDLDEKVTRDEWLAFANSWYYVMDEDQAGRLTHDQFIAKVRLLVTPPSIVDGRTKQTFGKEDAAAEIGQDFFNAMDANHDGQLTRDELAGTFAQWFKDWADPKTARLTQPALQKGLDAFLTKSVFEADQSYIAQRDTKLPTGDESGGRGERGGRGGRRGGGGGGGGNSAGLNVGPMHIGTGGGGRGGRGGDSRGLITFAVQLDPLEGVGNDAKPLLSRMLAVPAWRTQYLQYLSDITDDWLLWTKLGPVAKEYHDLIADDVRKDAHKPASYEHFVQELDQDMAQGPREGDEAPSLKAFVTERRAYLLKTNTIKSGAGY